MSSAGLDVDITNPDMWKQEWTAFASAPYIILPFIVAGWLAGWWFRGRTKEGEIGGLKGEIAGLEREISAWDQRLKLAGDALAASDRAKDELDRQFQAYKADVAARGSNASPAKVEAAIIKVADSNTNIGSSLLKLHRWLEVDQDGGQSARPSLPVGSGHPDKVYGTTLNSIPDHLRKRE